MTRLLMIVHVKKLAQHWGVNVGRIDKKAARNGAAQRRRKVRCIM